jgi:hypothetical protein
MNAHRPKSAVIVDGGDPQRSRRGNLGNLATRSPAVHNEQMRKLFVLKCSPVSCFVTAILVISKEMIQNSEQFSPVPVNDPPFTEKNDRLFAIAGQSVPLRFGLNGRAMALPPANKR